MIINVQFAESKQSFAPEFKAINNISDGGYERGYESGYEEGYGIGYSSGEAAGQKEIDSLMSVLDGTATVFANDNLEELNSRSLYESKAVSISLPKLKTAGSYCFFGCASLEHLYVPELRTVGSYFLRECPKLEILKLPNLVATPTGAFRGDTSLKMVDLGKAKTLGNQSFMQCSSLKTIILRNNTVATNPGSTLFSGVPDEGKNSVFYVPKSLVEEYKTAKYWTDYANQFRALEDYTVDGTVTGELDETKI